MSAGASDRRSTLGRGNRKGAVAKRSSSRDVKRKQNAAAVKHAAAARRRRAAPAAARRQQAPRAQRSRVQPKTARTKRVRGRGELWKLVKVGFHLGNTKTIVTASRNGDPIALRRDAFPNVVGFLKLDSLRDGLPDDARVLFDEEAFRFRRQLDLRRPIRAGRVVDVEVCRRFAAHLCSSIEPTGTGKVRAVVSIPARATPHEWEQTRRGMGGGAFERVLVIPEPYLAAEGMHLEPNLRAEALAGALTRASLVIDIGAAVTDLCLVRGEFPGPQDQESIGTGGNFIDQRILTNGLVRYPGLCLTHRIAREIKEEQAYVDGTARPVMPPDSSSSDLVALSGVIHCACEELLAAVANAACEILGRCDADSVGAVSKNIILAGGGSRIRGFAVQLGALLRSRGFDETRILVPADHRLLVARGALRFAEKLPDEKWEALASWSPVVENPLQDLGAANVGLRSQATLDVEESPEPRKTVQAVADAAQCTDEELPETTEIGDDFGLEDLEELELFKNL